MPGPFSGMGCREGVRREESPYRKLFGERHVVAPTLFTFLINAARHMTRDRTEKAFGQVDGVQPCWAR